MARSWSPDAAARSRPSALLPLFIALLALPALASMWMVPGRNAPTPMAPPPVDTLVLYGPAEFITPTGLPQTYVEEFTANVLPGAYQVVRVVNGQAGGAGRVGSLSVQLNGTELITGTFDETVASVEVPVTFLAENTLEVTPSGAAGSGVTVTALAAFSPRLTIYGPTQFVPPKAIIETFIRPADVETPDSLFIVNGNPDGTNRISSGHVTLNGTEVASPDDFGQEVAQIALQVSLLDTNELEVRLSQTPGGFVTIHVTAAGGLSPVAHITSPAPGTVTTAAQVTVTGSVQAATAVTVAVNGQAATVGAGNSYEATVPLSGEGAQTLSVVATDANNRTGEAVRTIVRDLTPPVVTVNAPQDGLITSQTSVTVIGSFLDLTPTTVNANGFPLVVDTLGGFNGVVSLNEGANVITITATDAAGNSTNVVRIVTRDTEAPVLTVTEPLEGATTTADSVTVSGTVEDLTAVTVAANGLGLPVASGAFTGKVPVVLGPNLVRVIASDGADNADTVERTVTRLEPGQQIPPDPSTVAPPNDPTVVTTVLASTAFLYTGPDPIQTGVDSGTIQPLRAAVIRGSVLDTAGDSLSGVQISIQNHAEFGQTLSRADGRFDLVVNGGGNLTVSYAKSGYVPAQRTAAVAWEDYTDVEDVVLLLLDTVVTTIDFSDSTEVAQGSVITDDDGTRQATLVFEQGTVVTMVMPDSSVDTLTSINVRATELTVGARGPQAMPARLPAPSAYTYAVEVSVDEAVSAGARSVEFSQPVAFYVDNFLGIATGLAVPVGSYDREAGRWVPERDGRVIKILSTNPVQIAASYPDTTTAAAQAVLDSLGISGAELVRLGALYSTGKTLWRVEVTHLTPFDLNFAFAWVRWALAPLVNIFRPLLSCQSHSAGSIIGCEGQTLGEDIGIAGTPFTLHYQSDRNLGYAADREVELPALNPIDTVVLAGGQTMGTNEFPSHVKFIRYILRAGGRTQMFQFPGEFAVAPITLEWDGLDAYGRPVNGSVKSKVHVQFAYSNGYAVGLTGGGGGFGSPPPAGAVAFTGRYIGILEKVWEGTLGSWDNRAGLGLGGWSLSAHHVYDPTSGTLLLGSGERRAAGTLGNVAKIIPATRGDDFAKIGPGQITVAPDGRVVIPYLRTGLLGTAPGIIRFLGPDGTFVDSITDAGRPNSVALAPDGRLYWAERDSHRIWVRTPEGNRSVFAGTGTIGFAGDGGPATAAQLCSPEGIALGPDGSLFIADRCNNRIRRVGPDGIISTYAGTGSAFDFVPDGALATETPTPGLRALAVLLDGTLIYTGPQLVRQIQADGRVRTVAGYRPPAPPGPTPARSLYFTANAVAVEPDGSLIVSEPSRVYRVTLDGSLEVVAGVRRLRCAAGFGCDPLVAQDLDLAPQTVLEGVIGLGVGPDGTIYLAESFSSSATHVRSVRPALPGLTASNMLVAAADGREVYEFNAGGRHLRTVDGFTGKALVVFDYDTAGRVIAVRDSLNNTTTIERDGQGTPTAIIAPFGQRTELSLDANGYLSQVEDPAGNRVQVTHTETGLLQELKDPRDRIFRFGYDLAGRLVADTAPDGGVKALERAVGDSGYAITLTSALGRTTTYAVDIEGSKTERRTVTDPAGLATTTWRTPSGVDSTRTPDGTRTLVTRSGDPRFGTSVSFPGRLVVKLPSGDSSVITNKRSTIRSDSANPFTLTSETDVTIINGRTWQTAYDAATQRVTSTSPAGRQSFTTLDSLGRVRVVRTPGLDSVVYGYDARGRLQQVQTGGRVASYTYDGAGRLATTTDPLGRTDSLFYDAADRLTRQVLPGGREIGFAYDSSGNLTSVTPPSQPAHLFRYTALDLDSVYVPPTLGAGTWSTQYRYDLDRQLTRIVRPGGDSIVLAYEALTGRPSGVTFDRGTLGFSYSGSTGQLTSLTGPAGTSLGFTYDGFLPTTVTWGGPVAGSVGVGYDSDFRVASQTVNGANGISFGYDTDGLLTTAGALGIRRSATTGFVERDSLSGIKGAWSYDPKGALASYTATESSGDTLFRTSYVRDSLSRITELTEIVAGDTTVAEFTYDDAGRLETVTRNGQLTASYEYDGNGNRLSLTTQGGTVTGTYDDQDRMTSYGDATYTYGRNGELAEKVVGTDTTRYTYDALGNLTAVTLPDGTEIEYVIDPQNRRIGKKVVGQLVQGFLWQGQLAPVAELDSAGNVVSRFVYATRVNVPDYLVKEGQTYRLVLDHLGSVRLVVNTATDSVVQRLDYDEFGVVTLNTNPGFQPFGYAGGLYEEQTGLVRFGARDYDAGTGRWTSKDPIGLAGGDVNYYGYVLNQPLNFTDANGTIAPQLVGGILGAVFGGIQAYRAGGGAGQIGVGIAAGFVGGIIPGIALARFVKNPVVQEVLIGATAGFFGNLAGQIPKAASTCPMSRFDWKQALQSAAVGAAGNVVTRLIPIDAQEVLPGVLVSPLLSGVADLLLERPTPPHLLPLPGPWQPPTAP